MLTNQTSEISLTRAENLVIPDTVKRTRMDSPPKAREESQKKSKNQHNQMLMIEDQRSSEVSLMEMLEVLKTRMLNSENRQSISEKRQSISEKAVSDQIKALQEKIQNVEKKNLKWENTVLKYKKKISHLESIGPVVQKTITEQSNTITVLKAQVASTQKKLELALKSINTAPQVCQPPQYKEKVASPVKQTSSKMTVEEEELKARGGYDYDLMKGNEGWITVPE
jgi:predicted metallo-beta-lactamase superfamily hydrolase